MTDEVKVEETKEEKATVELPDKLQKIMKSIEELSVIELATLVKALEEKFGVSAAAAVINRTAPFRIPLAEHAGCFPEPGDSDS